MPSYKFHNYKGDLVTAPKDFSTVVQGLKDGLIVWSVSSNGDHRVRYGLQVTQYRDSMAAAHAFGECIHHNAECCDW